MASITINGNREYLGTFNTEREASQAYIARAREANATLNTCFYLDDQYF
jgi:CHASE3 domain sensor protein